MKRIIVYILIFIFLCVFLRLVSGPLRDVSDDAFISFRYARHLAEGKGLVFNEGERVEGYTNFLWVVLMAAGYKAGFDIAPFSQFLSLICAALLVLAVGLFSKSFFADSRFRYASYIGPALLALNPLFWEHIGTGLETLLFVLLLFLSLVTYLNHGRKSGLPYFTGVLLGLAYLTRPEAALWAFSYVVIDVIDAALDRRDLFGRAKTVAAYACVFAVIAGMHFAWRFGYYGDWLPNTYYVKGASNWTWGKIHLREFLRSAGFLPLIGVAGGLFVLRKKWAVCMSVLISLLLFHNLRIGGDIILTGRFLYPTLPLVYLLIQELVRLALVAGPGAQKPSFRRVALAWCFPALVVVLFASGAIREWRVAREESATSRSANSFARSYAICIKEHTRPDDAIAVVSAGILPYYSERPAIDMLGLNDRHIARNGIFDRSCFIGHQKTDTDYILDRAPKVIVLPPRHPFQELVAAEKYMRKNPRLDELYKLTDLNCGNLDIQVYMRRAQPLLTPHGDTD